MSPVSHEPNTPGGQPLDEPGKLCKIITPRLKNDNTQSVMLANGARADLLLDAVAQDDCAAYMLQGEQVLVAGSDYVRGPKFALYEAGHLDDYDIGWYLAGANLSDIAAMGAVPLGVLSVVRYPRDLPDDRFAALIDGIRDCCDTHGARNVGGDIGSAERIILSASAFGVVERSGLLTRTAARPGQVVCVTGPTGLAGAAMQLDASGRVHEVPGETYARLLSKWRRVSPRIAHGRAFAAIPQATACLDTSDGLKGALETLARSSGVAMRIDRARLPVDPAVEQAAAVLGLPVLDLIFGDSVDFELVITVDEDAVDAMVDTCSVQGLDLFPIGEVVDGDGVTLTSGDGIVPGQAWRHDR